MSHRLKFKSQPALFAAMFGLASAFGWGQATPRTVMVSGSSGAESTAPLRTIDDRALGLRWFLLVNEEQPVGPGRLIALPLAAGPEAPGTPQGADIRRRQARRAPVIHAGDAVVIEEHSEVADGELVATALGPAAVGAALRVRLKLSGRIVLAQALSQGHARLTLPEAW